MEIKATTGNVIYESETAKNTRDLIEEALRSGADLSGADLRNANLRNANLYGADLGGAYIGGANLGGANLIGADLRNANLIGANLIGADLGGADLGGAYLGGANLIGADLIGADLRNANLIGANLIGANLRKAKNIPYVPMACPSDGGFTGWKKVVYKTGEKLIRLFIPDDAKRSSATSSKCRCDKAKVVAITSLDERESYAEVTNYNYVKTTYNVGEMVYPDSFDDDRWNECSHGIHFFINKQDAINY